MLPKISVIIPVYNMESYIHQCLDSVTSQTLKEIEIICVDDGSTDNSSAIVKEYADKDTRVHLIFQKNQGSGPARNNGLSKATGEFVAFMDPDDYYPSNDVLEVMFNTAKEKQVLICGGSVMLVDENSEQIPNKDPNKEFISDGLIQYVDYQCAEYYWKYIYNRLFLSEHNLTFPNYRRGQDPPFFLRAMIVAGSFYAMKKFTYCWRYSYKNINWNNTNTNDYLKAIRDVLLLSSENGLVNLYNKYLITYFSYYRIWVTNKLDVENTDFICLAFEVNNIIKNASNKIEGVFYNKNRILKTLCNIFLKCSSKNRLSRLISCNISMIEIVYDYIIKYGVITFIKRAVAKISQKMCKIAHY